MAEQFGGMEYVSLYSTEEGVRLPEMLHQVKNLRAIPYTLLDPNIPYVSPTHHIAPIAKGKSNVKDNDASLEEYHPVIRVRWKDRNGLLLDTEKSVGEYSTATHNSAILSIVQSNYAPIATIRRAGFFRFGGMEGTDLLRRFRREIVEQLNNGASNKPRKTIYVEEVYEIQYSSHAAMTSDLDELRGKMIDGIYYGSLSIKVWFSNSTISELKVIYRRLEAQGKLRHWHHSIDSSETRTLLIGKPIHDANAPIHYEGADTSEIDQALFCTIHQ